MNWSNVLLGVIEPYEWDGFDGLVWWLKRNPHDCMDAMVIALVDVADMETIAEVLNVLVVEQDDNDDVEAVFVAICKAYPDAKEMATGESC